VSVEAMEPANGQHLSPSRSILYSGRT